MKTSDLTAAEITRLLDLEPNATCGFVRVTYIAKQEIAPGGLPRPFASGGPLGSALYFLVTPEAPVRLHRIRNDQLYHYYLGDPLEVFMLRAMARSGMLLLGRTSLRDSGCSFSFLAIRSIPHVSSARGAGS